MEWTPTKIAEKKQERRRGSTLPQLLPNINNLVYYREGTDYTQTFSEFSTEFGFVPAGVNDYYGLVQANADVFQKMGTALNPKKQSNVLQWILRDLNHGSSAAKIYILGLEPSQKSDPSKDIPGTYDFVRANLPLVEAVATELDAFQAQAAPGKTLHIVVRYASEMNSGDTAYGPPATDTTARAKQIADYIDTFQLVRAVFYQSAPNVVFSFSPALRADRRLGEINAYWPGSQFVDIIGGTWYVRGDDQYAAATALMKSYFQQFAGSGRPWALSEVGGLDEYYQNPDLMLTRMFAELAQLPQPLDYAALFLNKTGQHAWGNGATLGWITNRGNPG